MVLRGPILPSLKTEIEGACDPGRSPIGVAGGPRLFTVSREHGSLSEGETQRIYAIVRAYDANEENPGRFVRGRGAR